MESQGNPPLPPPLPPPQPPQFNPNPNPWGGWDHSLPPSPHPPPPPPPPLPPPNYGWQGPVFPPADCTFHHPFPNREFHHDADIHGGDFQGGSDRHFHYDGGDFYGGADHHFNPPFENSKPLFARKRKFECADGGNYAKLYVAGITRTVTEEEIYRVFEEHGNVVEVVLLNDKRTGQHHDYCFVKYASTEEADRAIMALHNHFMFPGGIAPVEVRYASGERERLGLPQHNRPFPRSGMVQNDSSFPGPDGEAVYKVYVDNINKEASRKEVMEIFSSYGDVADVYIMRDKLKQRRGPFLCGFVGFTHRYMAVAAINGLSGTYVMRGCNRPLFVRFADPKKPKNGEVRSVPNSLDLRGTNLPNISHPGISSASTQESTTNVQTEIFTHRENQLQYPNEVQKPQQPYLPPQNSQMSLQQSQTFQPGLVSREANMDTAVLSSEPASCASSGSGFSEQPVDCEWSEHICPDGFKYYFNCVTCESRWEKPEEFALHEQRLLSQRLQNSSSEEPRVLSASEPPTEEECLNTSRKTSEAFR